MKLCMCQMAMSSKIEENLGWSLQAMEQAAKEGAELILFPELQLTPFFPQYPQQEITPLELNHPYLRALCNACQQFGIMAAPNVYLLDNGKAYDATLLIDKDGTLLGVQKMVHIAQMPHFFEQDYYTPSNTGFQVFDTSLGKIGIVVCFDRHYPESVRTEALQGADLILIPTANTTDEPSELFEWEIRVQAFQNSTAIAMCNRVGREGAMHFCGESLVVSAYGELLVKASTDSELVYVELSLAESANAKAKKPYLNLRRKEWYL